jgi:hypothetical protein
MTPCSAQLSGVRHASVQARGWGALLMICVGCTASHRLASDAELTDSGCPAGAHWVTDLGPRTRSVAFDETYVLIAAPEWRFRAPKRGGAQEELTQAVTPRTTIFSAASSVVDGTHRYQSDADQGTIERCSLGDDSECTLFARIPPVDEGRSDDELSLVLDESFLYVAGHSGRVFRVHKASRQLGLVVASTSYDDDDFAAILAIDDQHIYFMAGIPPWGEYQGLGTLDEQVRLCRARKVAVASSLHQ